MDIEQVQQQLLNTVMNPKLDAATKQQVAAGLLEPVNHMQQNRVMRDNSIDTNRTQLNNTALGGRQELQKQAQKWMFDKDRIALDNRSDQAMGLTKSDPFAALGGYDNFVYGKKSYKRGGMIEGKINRRTGDDTIIKAKKGEYVLPVKTVDKIGKGALDNVVKSTTGKNPRGGKGGRGFESGGFAGDQLVGTGESRDAINRSRELYDPAKDAQIKKQLQIEKNVRSALTPSTREYPFEQARQILNESKQVVQPKIAEPILDSESFGRQEAPQSAKTPSRNLGKIKLEKNVNLNKQILNAAERRGALEGFKQAGENFAKSKYVPPDLIGKSPKTAKFGAGILANIAGSATDVKDEGAFKKDAIDKSADTVAGLTTLAGGFFPGLMAAPVALSAARQLGKYLGDRKTGYSDEKRAAIDAKYSDMISRVYNPDGSRKDKKPNNNVDNKTDSKSKEKVDEKPEYLTSKVPEYIPSEVNENDDFNTVFRKQTKDIVNSLRAKDDLARRKQEAEIGQHYEQGALHKFQRENMPNKKEAEKIRQTTHMLETATNAARNKDTGMADPEAIATNYDTLDRLNRGQKYIKGQKAEKGKSSGWKFWKGNTPDKPEIPGYWDEADSIALANGHSPEAIKQHKEKLANRGK